MERIIKALGLSILLHALFLVGMSFWSFLQPSVNQSKVENIEISLESPSDKKNLAKSSPKKDLQIVRSALAPEKIEIPEDETPSRFLSQEKQRVKNETQAAANGMTKNKPLQLTQPRSVKTANLTQSPSEDGYRKIDISKELQEMNHEISTNGDSLPADVKVGSFTSLNTDRYLYYSFYARVEELIRYRWEARVQNAINGFDRISASDAGDKNWNSQVEFLLDENGFLKQALIMKPSGIKSFDNAAIEAFKEARVFPNPPKEMIQEDGFIHLKFAFNVRYPAPILVRH
jgi:TonB family protein